MTDSATHVYCDTCAKIQPAEREPLDVIDISGRFLGGDLLCSVCKFVVATVYRSRAEEG